MAFRRTTPADELAGYPSRELDEDPIILRPGSLQYLGHQANHHDDDGTHIWTEQSDTAELLPNSDPSNVTREGSRANPAGPIAPSLRRP
jgi:hypothetical protein